LVLEMAEIGVVGKATWRRLRISRQSDLLSSYRPLSAHRAERRLRRRNALRWASTLSADRVRPLRHGNRITSAPDGTMALAVGGLARRGGWPRRAVSAMPVVWVYPTQASSEKRGPLTRIAIRTATLALAPRIRNIAVI